jgi:two-component system sensor histidine kinase MprB
VKLGTRIAVIAATAVAVAVLAASVGAYFAARDELMDEVDQSLVELANQAQNLAGIEAIIRSANPRRPFGRESGFDVIYLQAFSRDGATVAPPRQSLSLPVSGVDLEVSSGDRRAAIRDVDAGDVHLRMITVRLPSPPFESGATIQLARSLEEVDGTLAGLTVLLGVVGVGGVALAALLGLIVARGAIRPIGRLTEAAEHVAETQELAARIDVNREDEVGRLAGSFNAMLAALEESRVQQRRLVRDAGHELRTPLTALRTNIEVLNRADTMPPDQRRQLLDDVTFELEQLGDLVTELVDLATDPQTASEPPVDLRLDELIEQVVARFERRTGRTVNVDVAPERIEGRRPMLERAVSNLLENAHKFSPSEAEIEVGLQDGRVTVRDRGSGIEDGDRPHVFDRFYRATAARTAPGSGLGLSIVQHVAEDHGGTVFAEEAPGGGAVVGFTVPTRPEPVLVKPADRVSDSS